MTFGLIGNSPGFQRYLDLPAREGLHSEAGKKCVVLPKLLLLLPLSTEMLWQAWIVTYSSVGVMICCWWSVQLPCPKKFPQYVEFSRCDPRRRGLHRLVLEMRKLVPVSPQHCLQLCCPAACKFNQNCRYAINSHPRDTLMIHLRLCSVQWWPWPLNPRK